MSEAKIVMSGTELVLDALRIAQDFKTLYVMGCFGAPMTDKNKARYTSNYIFNKRKERQQKIMAADRYTYGFDCVCLIKAILWGWYGNPRRTYGGAKYEKHGIPDIGANDMIEYCKDVSQDMAWIEPGEVVHLNGHIGIYAGQGEVVECSPRGKDGVQVTSIASRNWTKHGRLPWVLYHGERERVE